jgi:MFS-type transporter involved in bile tolerance (Atg22 family)
LLRRPVVAWALCDWANSAFATTVMAGFFPVFFKQYWSAGTEASVSTFQLGVANSAGSLVIALLAPLLGAMADRGGGRRRRRAGVNPRGAGRNRRRVPPRPGARGAGAQGDKHPGNGV